MATEFPPYRVVCYARGCGRDAVFKIAAEWSDGLIRELKTYSLCCATCLGAELADARGRRDSCRLGTEETLSQPMVFEVHRGQRDAHLRRRVDLEQ